MAGSVPRSLQAVACGQARIIVAVSSPQTVSLLPQFWTAARTVRAPRDGTNRATREPARVAWSGGQRGRVSCGRRYVKTAFRTVRN
jgi:hypothetical protein